jgi:putative spermidine/putrescine transport system permease protein
LNLAVSILFRVSLALILLFITLPIIVVVVASVSPTAQVTLLPWNWTVDWYRALPDDRWIDPFLLSVKIATTAALISAVLGSLGAYVVAYEKCPGHNAIMSFLLSPLAVPQIIKGVAIVLFLSSAGLYQFLGTPGLIVAHVILTLPFAVRMIATSMFAFDKNLDRAAQILGAGWWQRLRYVLFPLIKPGIFSGMTFAFIVSFNNVPLSLFLVRPGQSTLPITVINYFEYSLDPVLAAVNVASLIFILLVIFLFEKLGGFSAQLHGGSK